MSDHTPGVEVAMAAVALEQESLKNGTTLSRKLIGPDHNASLIPDELNNLVKV